MATTTETTTTPLRSPLRPEPEAHCQTCVELGNTDAQTRREQGLPTNWWHCKKCGAHLDRFRGMSDQQCDCGAWYNASGQRLVDNWADNESNFNDDVDDLTGAEIAQLRTEQYGYGW